VWHQLGHVQVSTSLQADNHASTPPLFFTGRMPFLPPNQQRQSTEGSWASMYLHMGNDISVANPAANSNYRQISDSYQCSVPNVRRNHTLTSTILWSNWSTTCADIAISHRFRQVQHSIMMNVTWRRFDQSAKQLIVVSLHYNVEKHRSIL